jgi:hypothetical protein
MAITVAPLTTTVMEAVDPGAVGIASGVNNAVASVAGLLAVASFGMVMFATFNVELRRELAAANVAPPIAEAVIAQRAKLEAIEPPSDVSPETRSTIRRAVAGAFVSGFRRIMAIAAFLALVSAISAWWMIGPPPHARARKT